ncbi:MAG: isopeptide-forming domain-containing fimbrial protein [Oscillospiraceae bacterium]|jgi:fimbrial isopeptide formation D2 family protein|nr:isopeptide-forming domain-containing fimbrial protein [Oscillospiraceae bacterium]
MKMKTKPARREAALRWLALIMAALTMFASVVIGMLHTSANPDGVKVRFYEYRGAVLPKAEVTLTPNAAGEYIPPTSLTANISASGGRTFQYAGMWSDDNGLTIHTGQPPTLRNVSGDVMVTLYFTTDYTIREYFRKEGDTSVVPPVGTGAEGGGEVVLPYRSVAYRSGEEYKGLPALTLTTEKNVGASIAYETWNYVGYKVGLAADATNPVNYSYPALPTLANVQADQSLAESYVYVYRQYDPDAPIIETTARVSHDGGTTWEPYESGDANWCVDVEYNDIIEYRLTVTANSVVPNTYRVYDWIPANLAFDSATTPAGSDAWTNTLVGGRRLVQWNFNTAMTAGTTREYSVRVRVNTKEPQRFMNCARLEPRTGAGLRYVSQPVYHEVLVPEVDPEKTAYLNNSNVAENGTAAQPVPVDSGDKIRYEIKINKPPRAMRPQFDIVFALDWSGSMKNGYMITPLVDAPNVNDITQTGQDVRLNWIFAKEMVHAMCDYVFSEYPDSRISVMGMSTATVFGLDGMISTNSNDPQYTFLQYNTAFVGREQASIVVEHAFNGDVVYISDDDATFMKAAVDKLAGPNSDNTYGGFAPDATQFLLDPNAPTTVPERKVNPRGGVRRVPVMVLVSDFEIAEQPDMNSGYNSSGQPYWSTFLKQQAERFSNAGGEFPLGSVFFPVRITSTENPRWAEGIYQGVSVPSNETPNYLMEHYMAPGLSLSTPASARANWTPTYIRGNGDSKAVWVPPTGTAGTSGYVEGYWKWPDGTNTNNRGTPLSSKAEQTAAVRAKLAIEVANMKNLFETAMPKPKTLITDKIPEGLVIDPASFAANYPFQVKDLSGSVIREGIGYTIDAASNTITWDLSTVPPGSYTVSVETTVTPSLPQTAAYYVQTADNFASVEYTDGQTNNTSHFDSNHTYHRWGASVTKHAYLGETPDFAAPMDGTPGSPVTVKPGDIITYEITVKNAALFTDSSGSMNTLSDTISDELTVLNCQVIPPVAGFTVAHSGANPDGSGGTVLCKSATSNTTPHAGTLTIRIRTQVTSTKDTVTLIENSARYHHYIGPGGGSGPQAGDSDSNKTYHQVLPNPSKNAYLNSETAPRNGTAALPVSVMLNDAIRYEITAPKRYEISPREEYDFLFAVNWSKMMGADIAPADGTARSYAQRLVSDAITQIAANYPNSRVALLGTNSGYNNNTNAPGYTNLEYNTPFVDAANTAAIQTALAMATGPTYDYADDTQLLDAAVKIMQNTAGSYNASNGTAQTLQTRGVSARIPVIVMISDFQVWEKPNPLFNYTHDTASPPYELSESWSKRLKLSADAFAADFPGGVILPVRLDHAKNKGLDLSRPELAVFSSAQYTQYLNQYIRKGAGPSVQIKYGTIYTDALSQTLRAIEACAFPPDERTCIVTDDIPAGLTIQANSLSVRNSGGSVVLAAPNAALTVAGQRVTWDLTSLPQGNYTCEVSVTAAAANDLYLNQAHVDYGAVSGRDTGNTYHRLAEGPEKHAYINGGVTAKDGTATKPEIVTKGDIIEYTVKVRIPAGGNTVVTDKVPAGLTLDVGSITGGGTWNAGTRTITWDLSSKPAGEYQFSYKAEVAADEPLVVYENWATATRPDLSLEGSHTWHQNLSRPTKNAYLETAAAGVFESAPKNGASYASPQAVGNGRRIKYEITAAKPKDAAAGATFEIIDNVPAGLAVEMSSLNPTPPNTDGVAGVWDEATRTITWSYTGKAAGVKKVSFIAALDDPTAVAENIAHAVTDSGTADTNKTWHKRSAGLLHIRQVVVSPNHMENPLVGYLRLSNGTGANQVQMPLTVNSGKDGTAVLYTDYLLALGSNMVYNIYDYLPSYYLYDGYLITTDNGNHTTANRLRPPPTGVGALNGSIAIDFAAPGCNGEWWVTVYITPKGAPGDYSWRYGTNYFGPVKIK